MAEDYADKRRFHRVLYRAPAELADDCGRLHPCEVVDLSLRGCLIEFSEPIALDREVPCSLTIPLDGENTIRMMLSPVHQAGRRIGFVCWRIDLESFICLRRLIELNLGDPKLLEREIEALCA